MLVVKNKKGFSPLGTKQLYFHVNSSRKNYIVLTPNMAALSRGCKPRIEKQFTTSETLGRMGTSFGCSDFWDRLVGQVLVMIGPWYSRQPSTNHR